MREDRRDPYTSPPLPRERSGPLMRFAIVVALLGAAVWAYMTYAQGPGLTQAATEEAPAAVADADASGARGYAVPPATAPQTTSPAEAESPSAMSAPAAPAEPLPPPTTGTIPPG